MNSNGVHIIFCCGAWVVIIGKKLLGRYKTLTEAINARNEFLEG